MKAIKLTGIRQMEIMDVPEPEIINPGDVKIKMSVVGICGSDIHYYKNGNIGTQVVQYPFTVGHEGAGVVVETGKKVTRVKSGDKIAIDPAMPCWECDQCREGRHHTCRNLRFLGCPGQAEGCLSEYIVMPEESCFPLGDRLTTDHGAISEPLAIGVYSVKKSEGVKNKNIGILGYGPIGMSVSLAAKAEHVRSFFVSDMLTSRLKIAEREGAVVALKPDFFTETVMHETKLGLDVVFECCGMQEAVHQAIDILKPGGKLVMVGIPEEMLISLFAEKVRRKEISIQFIRRQVDCVQPTLNLMNSGQIDVSRMVTHRFPLNRTKEAFDIVSGYKDGVMKAMVDF